ncbi:MAG TPA: ester cyclase [Terracidiphilus sp.]
MQDQSSLQELADRYTAAWCGQEPAEVASFFAPDGSLTINHGAPSAGRIAITEVARSFMTAFPDLRVAMDRLIFSGERVEYHWTLTGTNTGPGGSGRRVRVSGFESWKINSGGLIVDSQGHFDASDYDRQITGGVLPL